MKPNSRPISTTQGIAICDARYRASKGISAHQRLGFRLIARGPQKGY